MQDASVSHQAKGSGGIGGNMTSFFDFLDELGLVVTRRVAADQLADIRKELDAASDDDYLTEEQATGITEAMGTIRVTLDAELQGVHAYTPTSKRLDLAKLLENPKGLFGPGVFGSLPQIAQNDFGDAARCIAFEIPTAAAFHLMRGIEAVLRNYYQLMIRQKRILSKDWGPIITDLRSRRRTKKYEALNNHLDNIRVSFRNPTQHPDAEYDIHEVQDLYSVSIDVVNRMIKALKKEDKI